MKKLTLNLASALLAIACVANAENCANLSISTNDSSNAVRTTETPKTPTKPLTFSDFRMVKRQIDFNFKRLDSIRLPAMQCHMNVDHVNALFKRYAHVDAETYFKNLKRNSNADALTSNAELTGRQVTTSWPDPYIIGR